MRIHRASICGLFFALAATPAPALAATLLVGPGQTYATPCAAIAAAGAGDTIQVDGTGTYTGDTCSWSTDALTIRSVNGQALLDATGVALAETKGIFVIHATSATIENFAFTGAAISSADGNNGAGIRHQGTNLTVRNCSFYGNQDGILGAPPTDGTGTVSIEDSEFYGNGAGDGYSHNMYLNHYAQFTLQGSYSHDAVVGHLVKTRAAVNYILYNLIEGRQGTDSYEIDVPNGGTTYILGNVIEQGTSSQNPTIISYEEEGTYASNPSLDLFVVNNTIVNDLGSGTFVTVGADVTTPVLLENDIFTGGGTITSQPSAVQTTNFTGDPSFLSKASGDYRLTAGSPCVDTGTTPGTGDGYALTPTAEYVEAASPTGTATTVPRTIVGSAIDIGAYELGVAPSDAGIDGGFVEDSSTPDAGTDASPQDASLGDAPVANDATAAGSKSSSGCGVAHDASNGAGAALSMLVAAFVTRRRRL